MINNCINLFGWSIRSNPTRGSCSASMQNADCHGLYDQYLFTIYFILIEFLIFQLLLKKTELTPNKNILQNRNIKYWYVWKCTCPHCILTLSPILETSLLLYPSIIFTFYHFQRYNIYLKYPVMSYDIGA